MRRPKILVLLCGILILYMLAIYMSTDCLTGCDQDIQNEHVPQEIISGHLQWEENRHVISRGNVETADIIKTAVKPDGFAVCSNSIRRKNIEEFCNGPFGNTTLPNHIPQLKVIDQYKLLYCEIPKVGTTSMKTLFARIIAADDTWKYNFSKIYTDETGIRHFHLLNSFERERLLKNYRKMVVLRHPLDRLRSAYVEKIQSQYPSAQQLRLQYNDVIGNYLIEKGQVINETFNIKKDILTMEQFFDMVSQNMANFDNWHWLPFWQLCDPCAITYDFILKLETLEHDIEELYFYLKSINNSVYLPTMVHTNEHQKDKNKLELVSAMLRDFDVKNAYSILNFEEKDFLWAGYAWDRVQGAICATGKYDCC